MNQKGFSLIELMVGISIIGILMALTLTGISSSRAAARDAKRKADLELIRSGLEIYKADCDEYPTTASLVGGQILAGDGSPSACATNNTYISSVPVDPISPARRYRYARLTTSTYAICAALEKGGGGAVSCGSYVNCGSGTETVNCNYQLTNP